MFTAGEVFDLAIQVEANGERYYRFAQSRVIRDRLRELLTWLADQEVQHAGTLEHLKEEVCGKGGNPDLIPGLSRTALRSAMTRRIVHCKAVLPWVRCMRCSPKGAGTAPARPVSCWA